MDTVNTSAQQIGNGASRKIAEYVAGLAYERVSSQAVHAFKRALLDYLTCSVAGSRQDESRLLLEYFMEWDKSGEAAVVGSKARLACPNAAFVNGTSTHSLDFDDGLTRGSVHPAGAIFPSLLAVAEKMGASAQELIAAGVAAYDVTLRIASAMHPASQRRGFHNTPTADVFGAAAGAARLTLKNGTTLEKRVLDPKGEGENQMTDEDLTHKFRSNCEPIIGEARCDELLDAVWRLEQAKDLQAFFKW